MSQVMFKEKAVMARKEAVVFVAMGCGNPDMKICDMWMVCVRLFSRSVELECSARTQRTRV